MSALPVYGGLPRRLSPMATAGMVAIVVALIWGIAALVRGPMEYNRVARESLAAAPSVTEHRGLPTVVRTATVVHDGHAFVVAVPVNGNGCGLAHHPECSCRKQEIER